MQIKIITDSVADIPKDLARELDITVVPLSVHFGSASYRDGVDLTTDEFFEKLSKSNRLPTTSQVNPGEFKKVFEECLEKYDHIICVTMSEAMSGTYKAANIAKEFIGTEKIDVFDSKAISFGFGLVVIEAARSVKNGKTLQEIRTSIRYNIDNLENLFIVDTLEYLKKGGRLSTAEAFVGNVLKIKPVITINNEGKLESIDKIRGRKRVINYFVDYINKNGYDLKGKTVGLFHAVDREYLEKLITVIKEEFDVKEIIQSEVGTVVGTHSGPGCLAMVFIK
ncbi:MAG TPA: DegV family protein [Clostridia bacterium]|nr:DegV family protein [Clostridia bacterium]